MEAGHKPAHGIGIYGIGRATAVRRWTVQTVKFQTRGTANAEASANGTPNGATER